MADGAQRAVVTLGPDHPGFRDDVYRRRRDNIAQIALDYCPGTPVPDAPYSDDEHLVWREIWRQLAPAHQRWACREYLRASLALALPHHTIPQLRDVSERLQSTAGFRIEPVGGWVPPLTYLSALSDGVLLATQYIRHGSAPFYTPEPDIAHALIGHATLFASPAVRELKRLFGAAAQRTVADESLDLLDRVFWHTMEFGVIHEDGELRAFGAGLLSSAGELEAMHEAEIKSLDFAAMAATAYDATRFQPVLFCAPSFEAMVEQLRRHLIDWPASSR